MAGRFFIWVLFLVLGVLPISFVAESKEEILLPHPAPLYPSPGYKMDYRKEEEQIPKRPTAPPALTQRNLTDVPHCERHFLFQGKRMECDSEIGKDALGLSSLMNDLPYSKSELDIYRENRRKIRITAYTGTVGVFAMIAGVIVSHPILDPSSGSIRPGGFITLAGMALVANSLIYGLSMMKANEIHIANAVQYFNTTHPNQPIELEFSTYIDF